MGLNQNLLASLLCALLSFSASNASAETLEEAWDVAFENNHLIKSAKANTSASEQQLFAAQCQPIGYKMPEIVKIRSYPGQTGIGRLDTVTNDRYQELQFNGSFMSAISIARLKESRLRMHCKIGHNHRMN